MWAGAGQASQDASGESLATLPRTTIAALRLADRLNGTRPHIDAAFYAELPQVLDDDVIRELGTALSSTATGRRPRQSPSCGHQ